MWQSLFELIASMNELCLLNKCILIFKCRICERDEVSSCLYQLACHEDAKLRSRSQCIPFARNFLYCCLKIHATVSSTLSSYINVLAFSTLFNDTQMWKLHGIQLVLNSASHMWTIIVVSLLQCLLIFRFVLYLAMQFMNCFKRAALCHYMIYSPGKGILMSFWVCVDGFTTWHNHLQSVV